MDELAELKKTHAQELQDLKIAHEEEIENAKNEIQAFYRTFIEFGIFIAEKLRA